MESPAIKIAAVSIGHMRISLPDPLSSHRMLMLPFIFAIRAPFSSHVYSSKYHSNKELSCIRSELYPRVLINYFKKINRFALKVSPFEYFNVFHGYFKINNCNPGSPSDLKIKNVWMNYLKYGGIFVPRPIIYFKDINLRISSFESKNFVFKGVYFIFYYQIQSFKTTSSKNKL